MIVTNKFNLSSKELFIIMITGYLKKRWWMLAWIWITIGILLFRENNASFDYFLVAALLAIQLVIAFQYWGYAKSTDIQERYFEMDYDKIVGITEGGTKTSFENSLFINVLKIRKHYLLYTTRVEFICIPITCFKSLEDKEWFEKEVFAKIR